MSEREATLNEKKQKKKGFRLCYTRNQVSQWKLRQEYLKVQNCVSLMLDVQCYTGQFIIYVQTWYISFFDFSKKDTRV